jgi:phosphoserine phosphatase RsbU/P
MAMPRKGATPFRERTELLDFLLEVSAVTSETLELDRLLPAVADFVNRVIPHDIFAILLYNDKLNGLRIRYSRGHRDEVVRNLVIPLGEGITGIAAQTRQSILVNDVLTDSRYLPALDAVRSELAVPMVARNKLVGVIDIQSTRQNAFSDEDSSLLRLLAARVVSSIDNARLYRRVVQQNRTSRTLAQLSHEFSSILQLEELFTKIAKAVKTLINYDAFSVLLVDNEQKCLRQQFSERYDERMAVETIPLGKGITGLAAEQRETIKVDDTATDPRYIPSYPEIRSEVAVPLVVKDRVIGVMDLESERIGYFSDDHVRTISLLAPQIANSVENARLYAELAQREQRMEQDLKAARRVQSILLPREAPKIENMEIAIGWRPAREVSGDLFDFFQPTEDVALIAFGDSSGKGAAAALYGALVSGLLRSVASEVQRPSELMKHLNQVLLERRVDAHYVTLLLMHWHGTRRELTVANSGAIPPMICRKGERVKVRIEGLPLGLLEDREYDEIVVKLEPGDGLLLYSDGVQDQASRTGEEYGTARLFSVLKKSCDVTPKDVVQAVYADIDAHTAGGPMSDDQSLIAIRVS